MYAGSKEKHKMQAIFFFKENLTVNWKTAVIRQLNSWAELGLQQHEDT